MKNRIDLVGWTATYNGKKYGANINNLPKIKSSADIDEVVDLVAMQMRMSLYKIVLDIDPLPSMEDLEKEYEERGKQEV